MSLHHAYPCEAAAGRLALSANIARRSSIALLGIGYLRENIVLHRTAGGVWLRQTDAQVIADYIEARGCSPSLPSALEARAGLTRRRPFARSSPKSRAAAVSTARPVAIVAIISPVMSVLLSLQPKAVADLSRLAIKR
jgi:hypothetical protein